MVLTFKLFTGANGIPTTKTALESSSGKSIPSDNFPLNTPIKMAPVVNANYLY